MPAEVLAIKDERVDIDGEISIIVPENFYYQIFGSKSESSGRVRPFVSYKHEKNDYYLNRGIDTDDDNPFIWPETFIISGFADLPYIEGEKEFADFSDPQAIERCEIVVDTLYETSVNSLMVALSGATVIKHKRYFKSKDIVVYTAPIDDDISRLNFILFTTLWVSKPRFKIDITSI